MIYNHRNNNTLYVLANQMPSPRIGRSSSSSVVSDDKSSLILDYTLTARYDIKKGDELFTDYGGEQWFDYRSIKYVEEKVKETTCSITQASDDDVSSRSNFSDGNEECFEIKSDTDNNNTVVATNTVVNGDDDNSLIAFHGCPMSLTQVIDGKVYAVQYIAQNSIIEISRALLVPDHIGDDNDLERYLWYSSHNPNRHAILLFGQGALYSTPAESQNDLEIANLYYSWYFFDDDNESSDSSSNRKCEQKMFIHFRARRNIEPNEELTVPLGLKVGSNRRYLLEHWLLEELEEWCL